MTQTINPDDKYHTIHIVTPFYREKLPSAIRRRDLDGQFPEFFHFQTEQGGVVCIKKNMVAVIQEYGSILPIEVRREVSVPVEPKVGKDSFWDKLRTYFCV